MYTKKYENFFYRIFFALLVHTLNFFEIFIFAILSKKLAQTRENFYR